MKQEEHVFDQALTGIIVIALFVVASLWIIKYLV